MRSLRSVFVCVALVGLLAGPAMLSACPFCSAPSLTVAEQIIKADAVVLVQWASADKGDEQNPDGDTTYEIMEIRKGPTDMLKKGQQVTVAPYRPGNPGDLALLMGTKATTIEWSPLDVTEASYQYIAQAPAPETPVDKRLAYFLTFLEDPDPLVANDAYAEFANAPYKDIATLADQMPLEKIRGWVASPETPSTRLGLYGLLLGLCGTAADAQLMQSKIAEPSQDYRLGIDGVMSGYLLLTGAQGLDVLDSTKLSNKQAPFSETYAAMQALRFLWTYAPERVDKDRLRQSMRTLLDRPELAELVITDLARWKDWSAQDRLMELYGAEQYDLPSVKRSIIRFLLVCSKDGAAVNGEKEPLHVTQSKVHLDHLRQTDAKTVREAEQLLF